jgi:plastocyanin
MRRGIKGWFGGVLALAGLYSGALFAADVSGEVRVEDEKQLRHLVVYLEPISAAPAAPTAPPTRIYQRGREFSPATVVVVRGEAVEFVNDEEREIDHNVYSLSRDNSFDVGLIPRGQARSVTFPAPGVVKYFCSVHKLMEGAALVVPGRYYAVVDAPGKFAIRNVPPGRWRVSVMATHRRYRDDPVEIEIASEPLHDVRVRMRRRH